MAARTSTSVAMGTLVTVLGIGCLAGLVTSMVFYIQASGDRQKLLDADANNNAFITQTDRNDPLVNRLAQDAKGKKQSLVRYMLEERRELFKAVTGSDRDSLKTIEGLKGEGQKDLSLSSILQDRQTQLDSASKRLADAEAARDRALVDKENEAKRVKVIEDASRQAAASMNEQVQLTKTETDAMRDELAKFKASMDERVDKIRSDGVAKETGLKSEIDKLQSERIVDRDRLRRFEQEFKGQRFSGQAEYTLTDGTVIGSSAGEGTVTLSIGRKDRVVLGLPFTVYAQGTSIKPDDKTGEYPLGKATVEVIRIDEESSVARVLREQKGNPVLRGDIIANPIYDPAKKYKFMVYGNFDPQNFGTPTAAGAGEVRAWIKEWGGTVVDELAGDVDFVVLGSRPALPPEPSSSAPLESINFFIAQQRQVRRYEELLKQAGETSIPILNENRLRTLLGR